MFTEMAPLGLTPRYVHKILIAEHLNMCVSLWFFPVDCSGLQWTGAWTTVFFQWTVVDRVLEKKKPP